MADSKATNALAVAEGIKKLAELAALAPLPQEHNSVNTDYIEFNQFANHELSPVQMGWGTENGTLEIGMGYDAVIQHVGLESYYRIKATASNHERPASDVYGRRRGVWCGYRCACHWNHRRPVHYGRGHDGHS